MSRQGTPDRLQTTALVPAWILLPLLALAPALAQDTVSEITVIHHHWGEAIQPPPGFGKVSFDLIDQADGSYIYLRCRLVQP